MTFDGKERHRIESGQCRVHFHHHTTQHDTTRHDTTLTCSRLVATTFFVGLAERLGEGSFLVPQLAIDDNPRHVLVVGRGVVERLELECLALFTVHASLRKPKKTKESTLIINKAGKGEEDHSNDNVSKKQWNE